MYLWIGFDCNIFFLHFHSRQHLFARYVDILFCLYSPFNVLQYTPFVLTIQFLWDALVAIIRHPSRFIFWLYSLSFYNLLYNVLLQHVLPSLRLLIWEIKRESKWSHSHRAFRRAERKPKIPFPHYRQSYLALCDSMFG